MRERTVLAWRTAYYHRVKHMPDLSEELAVFGDARDSDYDEDGGISPERHAMIKRQSRLAFGAWNTKLAGA